MAEATAIRNNSLPYPVYGLPYTVIFPIFDADGDLVTGAADLDSEVSKNGDTYADCTNEATEIATSSGTYYLTLTAAELTTNIAGIIIKTSTSGAKTTPIVLYPRILPIERDDTAQAGAAGTITLDASANANDDYYNGCLIYLDGGTGSGQSRMITDYSGTTKVATVTPNWSTTPDATSTFLIYVPETANAQVKGLSTLSDINTELDTALSDIQLDHLFNVAMSGASVTNNSFAAQLTSKSATADFDDYDNTTDSLQAISDETPGDVLNTQMTESYAADGVEPTLAQALFAILQNICEISKSGTTLTIKKLDGSTTAMTFTLDDADDPSSRTRSS